MKILQGNILVLCFMVVVANTAFGDGIVPPGTLEVGDYGTSANPAYWTLDGDFTAAEDFTIGHGGSSSGNYNILTVASGQVFTGEEALIVGPTAADHNCLDILAGGTVNIAGYTRIGTGTISYYSTDNKINVSGNLTVGGNFNIGSRTGHSGVLSLQTGGLAKVTGDFNLYSHWVYTNSWLLLNGGILALLGDRTADFAEGSAVLGAIKVWDDVSGDFQAVADYTGATNSSTVNNAYSHLLDVEYVSDVNDYLYGYTIVHAVPEPAAMILFVLGSLAILRRKKS